MTRLFPRGYENHRPGYEITVKPVEIFSFESGPEAAYAASHYFLTPDGAWLFDAQLLRDEAEDLAVQMAEDMPGAEIDSVFITSARLEHYASLGALTAQHRPHVYATAADKKRITTGAGQRLAALKEAYGPRAPEELVFPEETVRTSERRQWKELEVDFLDVGAREPAGNLVCFLPAKKQLIAGNLVFNKVHPFLDRLEIDSWVRSLDILSSLSPKTVYPGHGPVVGGEVLTHLKRYLAHFRVAVGYFGRPGQELTENILDGVQSLMVDKYPDYQAPENLVQGIIVEYERQFGRRAA